MKIVLLLFAACVGGVFAQVAPELEACGICTMVVNTLEGYLSKSVTKDDLMKQLAGVSTVVCENIPSKLATKEQCNSFVSLYGPYTIELLLSEAKPESICRTIGICDSGTQNPHYQLLFPSISSESINYVVGEENIVADTTFNYKMFLGSPAFLNNNNYELFITAGNIVGCDLHLKITNKTNYVETWACSKDKNCSITISKPGRGVWYYLTVSTKLHAQKASFSLHATERNSTEASGYWVISKHRHLDVGHFIFILSMTFSLVCLLCVCISRCVACKRKFTQRRYCQQQTEPTFVELPETVISIQESAVMEEPMVLMYPHNMPMMYPYGLQPYVQLQPNQNEANL